MILVAERKEISAHISAFYITKYRIGISPKNPVSVELYDQNPDQEAPLNLMQHLNKQTP